MSRRYECNSKLAPVMKRFETTTNLGNKAEQTTTSAPPLEIFQRFISKFPNEFVPLLWEEALLHTVMP